MKARFLHHWITQFSAACLVAYLLVRADALLASDESGLIPFQYQRWNQAGLDTRYPEDGPYVRVSARNLTYDRVLDRQSDTQALVYGYPLCGRGSSRRNLSARIGAGPVASGAELQNHWPWRLVVPRAQFDALAPVQQCNDSALDLSRSSGRPLQEILQEGFAVRLPRALTASARFTCDGSGLRRSRQMNHSVELDAWIHCTPNPLAGRARSTTPGTRGRSPDRSATSAPAVHTVESVDVTIADSHQATQCPARVRLEAALQFAGPGKVEAQWHASGDYRSPAQTFDVKGPGSTTIQHTLLVEPPRGSTTAVRAMTDDDTIKGWAMLVVTYEVRSGPGAPSARANRTWNSERLNYEINCLPESPPRMQLRRLPDPASGG